MSLLNLLITIVIAGIVAYIAFWGIGKIGLPEPFNKVAVAIIVLAIVIFLIGVLTGTLPTRNWLA